MQVLVLKNRAVGHRYWSGWVSDSANIEAIGLPTSHMWTYSRLGQEASSTFLINSVCLLHPDRQEGKHSSDFLNCIIRLSLSPMVRALNGSALGLCLFHLPPLLVLQKSFQQATRECDFCSPHPQPRRKTACKHLLGLDLSRRSGDPWVLR